MAKAKAISSAKGTKPSLESQALIVEATQQYTLAIQLEPKSRQAFRGRAEAYQTLAAHPQLRKRIRTGAGAFRKRRNRPTWRVNSAGIAIRRAWNSWRR